MLAINLCCGGNNFGRIRDGKTFLEGDKKIWRHQIFLLMQIFLGVAKLFFGRDVNFESIQKYFGGSKNYISGGKIFGGDIKIFWMSGNKFGGRS